jgi:hypothetical protein
MMEVARNSETLVNFYQIIRRYNPEDSHLRTQRRENLKSYYKLINYIIQWSISVHNFTTVDLQCQTTRELRTVSLKHDVDPS